MEFEAQWPYLFKAYENDVERYLAYLELLIRSGCAQDEDEYLRVLQEIGRCRIYLELQEGKNVN